jgi:hypothetical protein
VEQSISSLCSPPDRADHVYRAQADWRHQLVVVVGAVATMDRRHSPGGRSLRPANRTSLACSQANALVDGVNSGQRGSRISWLEELSRKPTATNRSHDLDHCERRLTEARGHPSRYSHPSRRARSWTAGSSSVAPPMSCGHPVAPAVVALAQPPVIRDRNARTAAGHQTTLRRFGCSPSTPS